MLDGLIIWILALTAQIEATITPLSGPAASGQLMQLDNSGAALKIGEETQTFASDNFRKIEFGSTTPAENVDPIQVELTDGSFIRAQQFTVTDSTATMVIGVNSPLSIPTSAIRRVLLQEPGNPEQKELWEKLSTEELNSDILVYRRSTGGSLDSLDGVLHDVSAETIALNYDGEGRTAPRERVIGFSYFHPQSATAPKDVLCNVVDANGSHWRAADIELKDGALHWTTPTDVKVQAPLAQVQQLDYAIGNLIYLSDLKPEAERWEPFIDFRVGRESLAVGYAPRRDQSFDGGPLMLNGNPYSKGLALRSRTELVYRLTDEFHRFRAVAGLDDRVRDAEIPASLRLVISGDDKVLFEQRVAVADAPMELDLDVTGVRRLRILVDFGGDFDVADYLNLCEARLTK